MLDIIEGILSVPILIIVYTLSSFAMLFQGGDVSNEQRYENIYGKTFELQKDAFIYRFKGQLGFSYIRATGDPLVPYSLEDYLMYPQSWENMDTWAKRGCSAESGHLRGEILCPIEKGTKVTVKQIYLELGLNTCNYRIHAIVHKKGFDKDTYDIFNLFEWNFSSENYPFGVDESILKEVEEREPKFVMKRTGRVHKKRRK